jgi:hypothetical protein
MKFGMNISNQLTDCTLIIRRERGAFVFEVTLHNNNSMI